MARLALIVGALLAIGVPAAAQQTPQLTAPVNDFAGVVDPQSAAEMEALVRSLQQASGDVVVVATVDTFQPYADIREYAVRMFENNGRGIGQQGKDNGLLVLLAVKDRQVWMEVGYDLEEFITDGFAGETSRQFMAPEFRRGNYGAGLLAGVSRVVTRIAERRNVTLQGVRPDAGPALAPESGSGGGVLMALFVLFIVINALAGRMRRRGRFRGRWGGPIGWSSGVGPFGAGLGGFGRRGGFGGGFGGFGGFGGGRSGGGGGGASW